MVLCLLFTGRPYISLLPLIIRLRLLVLPRFNICNSFYSTATAATATNTGGCATVIAVAGTATVSTNGDTVAANVETAAAAFFKITVSYELISIPRYNY